MDPKFADMVRSKFEHLAPDMSQFKRIFADSSGVFYHYTSGTGLLGMLSSRSIWMSDSSLMNDYLEVRHGTNALRWGLDAAKNEFSSAQAGIAERAFTILNAEQFPARPLIFSMSFQGDLLNQWRYYGRETVAYSIGFNGRELATTLCEDAACNVAPILYSDAGQIEFCRIGWSSAIAMVKDLIAGDLNAEQRETVSQSIAGRLFAFTYYLKHPGFEAEREVRLFVPLPKVSDSENFEFRDSRFGLVPYLRAKMPEGKRLPIVEIWIGPSPHFEAAKGSLERLLSKYGYTDVAVRQSAVPFRQ